MSADLNKKIVTAGDSKINAITALGELKYLTSCLSKSMFHLNEYVNVKFRAELTQNNQPETGSVALSLN